EAIQEEITENRDEMANVRQQQGVIEVAETQSADMQDARMAVNQQMEDLARQLAEVEPAAGEGAGAGRGGFGFQSAIDAAPLGIIPPLGPIGPTALQYGLPEPGDQLFVNQRAEADIPGPPRPALEA